MQFSASFLLLASAAIAAALPAPEGTVVKRALATITPSAVVEIKADQPNTAFGSQSSGQISRSGAAHEISTIEVFTMPSSPDYSNDQCQWQFCNPDVASLSGSETFQLFTVGTDGAPVSPAPSSITFNNRPFRNQFIGQAKVLANGCVSVGSPFTCPAAGKTKNVELVPQNDNDNIVFTVPNGLQLVVNN